jgi:hypothetical protein
MTASQTQPAMFFYGLQPHWLSWDRLYRIYVCDKMLAGAYIAGQLYDQQSATLQLQQLRLFLGPLVRRRLAQRHERETMYDTVDPFATSLLDYDHRNFQVERSDVAGTRFRRKRSLWAPFNVGVVEIETLDGATQRFILVGDQEQEKVLELMRIFDPAIEVTGTPNPLPRPKALSPAAKRRYLTVLGVFCFVFAALFGYIRIAGIAADPTQIPLAVVNVLLGFWCLALAWKLPDTQTQEIDPGLTKRSR